ncbi:hypothetical protein ACWEPC_21705 [Nonomuraea sp. NPDC004297]
MLILRWFRGEYYILKLGRDHRDSRATAYRYIAEEINVLAVQAPDLHEAPDRAQADGRAYVILDGTLISTDRCAEQTISVKGEPIDAWYSAKAPPARVNPVQEVLDRIETGSVAILVAFLLQDVAVEFGYKPWRAATWLVGLLAIGGVVYAVSPPPPLKPGESPHFNAVIYALDLLLPIVDLGQQSGFNPG